MSHITFLLTVWFFIVYWIRLISPWMEKRQAWQATQFLDWIGCKKTWKVKIKGVVWEKYHLAAKEHNKDNDKFECAGGHRPPHNSTMTLCRPCSAASTSQTPSEGASLDVPSSSSMAPKALQQLLLLFLGCLTLPCCLVLPQTCRPHMRQTGTGSARTVLNRSEHFKNPFVCATGQRKSSFCPWTLEEKTRSVCCPSNAPSLKVRRDK